MTDTDARPTKVRGIIRANLDRIEGLQKSGYTRAAIIKLLEVENDLTISPTSFKSALYVARKDRQEGKSWIAQSTKTAPDNPAIEPTTQTPPPQPEREPTSHESEPQETRITPPDDQPLTAEDKKRRLAEATRAPIPNLEKYLPKPGRR